MGSMFLLYPPTHGVLVAIACCVVVTDVAKEQDDAREWIGNTRRNSRYELGNKYGLYEM